MNKVIKILLVEGDKNLGYILKSYLMMRGYPTTLCLDGDEALERYENEIYDFIISDINLKGMDGYSLARRIRESDMNIPLVFLTSKSSRLDVSIVSQPHYVPEHDEQYQRYRRTIEINAHFWE